MFHGGNNGFVGDDQSKTTYSQRFNLSDIKPLKKNMFRSRWTDDAIDKIFMGWSLSSVNVDNQPNMIHFENMEIVSKEIFQNKEKAYPHDVQIPFGTIKKGSVVHLYALWQTY